MGDTLAKADCPVSNRRSWPSTHSHSTRFALQKGARTWFRPPNSKIVLLEIWGYLQRNTAPVPHKYMWIRNMIIGVMIFSILPFSEVKYESICREIQCYNLTNTCELEIWSSWWWCWAVCFCQKSISSSQFNVSQITNSGISRKKYSANSSQIHVNYKYDHRDDDDDDDDSITFHSSSSSQCDKFCYDFMMMIIIWWWW